MYLYSNIRQTVRLYNVESDIKNQTTNISV